MNPGELPLGSAFEASEYSRRYHKYPLPPKCDGEKDYQLVLEKMIQFIHPRDKLPIFFSEGNTRDNPIPWRVTRKVIEKIFYESLEDDLIDDIKIYPLEELFFALQRITTNIKNQLNQTDDPVFPSIVYASHKFNEDGFEYTTKGCDFHEAHDASANCCLSKVRRAGYSIAKWCCNKNKYPTIEGAHYPFEYS